MVDVKNTRCAFQGCKVRASFPDGDGKPNVYCMQHAVELGLHTPLSDGCSNVACEFFDDLARETAGRISFTHGRSVDKEGRVIGEVKGLVAPHKHRPDAVRSVVRIADEPGVHFVDQLEVCFFHGNHYHGYPPEHPLHLDGRCVDNKSSKELYDKTMDDMALFKANNYQVCYVWEHEYIQYKTSQKKASEKHSVAPEGEAETGLAALLHWLSK